MAQHIRDLGSFESIQQVWTALPGGGMEGDYLTINGNPFAWNKFIRQWQNDTTVINNPARELQTHDGDMNIGNDARIGGNLVVIGNIINDSIKNGLSAFELAVKGGFSGSEADWLNSLIGKSAYQIWLEQAGNAGKNMTQFLAWMKDTQAIRGPKYIEDESLIDTVNDRMTLFYVPSGTSYKVVFVDEGGGTHTLANRIGDITNYAGIYDVSADNENNGVIPSYGTLSEAIDDIAETAKKGGMTIKYIGTDGKYHQYRYMLATTESGFTNTENWKVVGDATKEEINAIVNDIYVDKGNLSLGNEISYIINSAGKWIQGLGNNHHYLIRINPNDKVKVVANDNNLAICAWFTSNAAPVVNESAPISQVDSSVFNIAAGEFKILIAPSDARYLYVAGVYNGNTFTPQSITIVDKLIDVVDENKKDIEDIINAINVDNGSLNLGNEINYIINESNKWISGTSSTHYLVKINAGDKIKIVANDTHYARCAWFTGNDTPVVGDDAPVSSVDKPILTVEAGEIGVFTAPSDAQYLYVAGTYNETTFTPQSVTIVDKLADIVAETKDSIESITKASANDISRNVMWEVGLLDTEGNFSEVYSNRATSNLIGSKDEVTAIAAEGYQILSICYYDTEEVFQSRDWFTTPTETYSAKYDGYVRFIVRKTDNSNIADYEASQNIRIYRADENGLNIIDDISSKKVEYHEVQPYFETGMIVNLAGIIKTNSNSSRRLLWYPLKKGDTVRIVITFEDGVSINGRISFFNNESPSLKLECYSGYYYNTSNGVVEYTYTAPVDGFIGFTYLDNMHVGARILIHYGEDAKLGNLFIPKIGCGTQIVSRIEDTYCHSSMIRMNDNYIFVTYHGSNVGTEEPFQGSNLLNLVYQVLLVYNRKTGRSKYITIFDNARPDYIDGNKCTVYYNGTCIILNDTNTLLIKIGCQCNGKWIRIYKTYNADTDTLSDAAMQKIKYNNNTYDLNQRNYVTMVNTLYGTTFTLFDIRASNQITDMCYYDGKYYCVMALMCNDLMRIPDRYTYAPHVFCKSNDAITWEPIANVNPYTSGDYSYYSSETLLEIVEGIVYYVFRPDRLGEFYMVFGLDGTIIKAPQPISSPLSKVWSKPAITVASGRVIIGYNIVHDDSISDDPTDDYKMKYAPRTKMRLAEISQDNYELTELKTYFSSYGWNYYHFAGSEKGKIIGVNVEDSRDFNHGYNSPTSDVNIYEIDVNELLFEQEQS